MMQLDVGLGARGERLTSGEEMAWSLRFECNGENGSWRANGTEETALNGLD